MADAYRVTPAGLTCKKPPAEDVGQRRSFLICIKTESPAALLCLLHAT